MTLYEIDISHVVTHLCHSPTWMSVRKYGGAQLHIDKPIERGRGPHIKRRGYP